MVNVCKVKLLYNVRESLRYRSRLHIVKFNSVRLVQTCSLASAISALQIHTSHLHPSTSAHTSSQSHWRALLNSVRSVICPHAGDADARPRGLKERRVSIPYNHLNLLKLVWPEMEVAYSVKCLCIMNFEWVQYNMWDWHIVVCESEGNGLSAVAYIVCIS